MPYDYDVFLSYRHRPLDGEITQKTFNMIESYKLPKSLKDKGHDIKRAFRDTEELAVSRILTDTIDKALHSCNCLVVVCSTDTPSSEWIDREVSMFIELGRPHKIFPLLISGDPESSFPPSLKKIPDIMDRVMDVRCEGNDPKKIIEKEKTALLKVLAEATDVNYQELVRENSLRSRNKIIAKAGSFIGVMALVSIVSLSLMNLAQNYRDKAKAAENASMSVLQELTYGIPDKLSSVPGAYSKLSGILKENAEQINKILLLSTDTVSANNEIAANYEKYATALSVLGEYGEAAESQLKAVEIYRDISNDSALASGLNNMATLLSSSGRYEEAIPYLEESISILRNSGDASTLSTVLSNACGNSINLSDNENASLYYQEANEILSSLKEDYSSITTKANLEYNYAVFLYRAGQYAESESHFINSYDCWQKICAETDSIQNRNSQLQAISSLSMVLTDQGKFEEAEQNYLQAIVFAEELAKDDENLSSATNLASLYNNLGINYNMQGDFENAGLYYEKATSIFEKIANSTSSVSDITSYASSCFNTGDNYFKLGSYEKSKLFYEKGIKAYSSIENELSKEGLAEYYAWYAYYTLIHESDPSASLDFAIQAYNTQPDSILANTILGYACLYNNYYDDADQLLTLIASLGGGQSQMLKLDILSQQKSGLNSDHIPDILELLNQY